MHSRAKCTWTAQDALENRTAHLWWCVAASALPSHDPPFRDPVCSCMHAALLVSAVRLPFPRVPCYRRRAPPSMALREGAAARRACRPADHAPTRPRTRRRAPAHARARRLSLSPVVTWTAPPPPSARRRVAVRRLRPWAGTRARAPQTRWPAPRCRAAYCTARRRRCRRHRRSAG